ncbi:MAG: transketolase C-terminal domain-containing protein [Bryobacteraceae bacterium]|jgi:transketolase
MRAAFLQALLEEARRDARIILVDPDSIGFHCEAHRRELPDQYLNMGIAEQNAVGVSAGLALTGQRPFLFNILAFNSFRCFEQVRLDVCAMHLSVVLVGIGAGIDYGMFGPSHHTMEDVALMRSLPGMTVWSPADEVVAAALVRHCVQAGGPAYLRLHRADKHLVYRIGAPPELNEGLAVLRPGRDLLIAATGPMVRRAEEVAEALSARSVDAGVVDVFRLKPFPEQRFVDLAKSFSRIATLEEHFISGGLGSAVLEAMADYGLPGNVRRFGLPDRFCRVCGDRDYLHRECGLDAATLVAQFGGWLRTPRGFGVS